MTQERRYIRKSDCEAVSLEEEWMILNARQGTITKVNEVGGFCWALLETPQSITTIAEGLEHRYNVSPPPSTTAIQQFIARLLECDLIEDAT